MRPENENTEHTPQPATSTTSAATATADRSGDGEVGGFHPLKDDERTDARRRWDDIESRFVDDPAGATKAADDLLGDVMDRITRRFEDHRRELRDGWDGDDATTEQLRTTLKRYRDSLERLLGR